MAGPEDEGDDFPDDRLRLIFTCCHPALALEAQVALTLRTLCGLETDEIARAFLVPAATMAQRLVRTKRKIEAARIPYIVPEARDIPARLDAVLRVLYLVFNEGYAATSGDSVVRADLTGEAIRLTRLVCELMAPDPPAEAIGLLALMLLHEARRDTRVDADGVAVLLDDQDRTRWDQQAIAEAQALIAEARPARRRRRPLRAAGRDCRGPRRRGARRGHRLAGDPRPLRPARARSTRRPSSR